MYKKEKLAFKVAIVFWIINLIYFICQKYQNI